MTAQALTRSAAPRHLTSLALMNGVSVSTLYWAQSLVFQAAAEFHPSPMVKLMPGATLAGYAAGVAVLATLVRDLTSATGLMLHLLVLVAGLCAAATAPGPGTASLACLVIGLGCALTQRLLACATDAVPQAARPQVIGWIIASGLFGIVLARACVPLASVRLGWRAMFCADAVIVSAVGLAVIFASSRAGLFSTSSRPIAPPPAAALWRRERDVRHAALQQALVFAAFNLGWALFPRRLALEGAALPVAMVASLGAGAAILSGRLCRQRSPAKIATAATVTAVCAITLLLVVRTADTATMALLDISTQVALVANQARAQAVATSAAIRGRVTAMVTTIGFAGGAIGAALGNLIG